MKEAIRRARKESGLTYDELSALSGVGVSTLSNWENGYSTPTVYSAALVADALGISIDRLIGHKTQYRPNALHREFYTMKRFIRDCGLTEDYEGFKKEVNDG